MVAMMRSVDDHICTTIAEVNRAFLFWQEYIGLIRPHWSAGVEAISRNSILKSIL